MEKNYNMRSVLYEYIKSNSSGNYHQFCERNGLEYTKINDFIYAKNGGYLEIYNFDKIVDILSPSEEVLDKWKNMYLLKEIYKQ